MDYLVFGSTMQGRSWTTGWGSYRFAFNGQEKTDEMAGSGNHNTALFWEYDTRLGRRWNLDPKPQISISDYACFGNNPILFSDMLGDIFDITDDKKSKSDVKSLAKTKKSDNSKYLTFTKLDNGNTRVGLDFGNLSKDESDRIINSDAGLSLINNLINAKDDSGDLSFLYDAGDVDKGIDNNMTNTNYNKFPSPLSNINNWSTTPRMGLNGEGEMPEDPKNPPTSYSGYVRISSGAFAGVDMNSKVNQITGKYATVILPRASVIYHELNENLYRTLWKMPYKIESTNKGAHRSSIDDEKKGGNPWNNPTIGAEGLGNMIFIKFKPF